MSFNAPAGWAPSLTSAQFRTERLFLAGVLTGTVAYGVHATLFITTMCVLWRRGQQHGRRQELWWMAYITVAFLISSIAIGGVFQFAQMIFIDDREYPGGPSAFLVEQSTASVSVMSQVAYIMSCWLQDGLLVYRVWVIFGRSYIAAAIPMLLYLGLLGGSFTLVILMTCFQQTLYEELTQRFVVAHFSIAIAFSILVTTGIVIKLLLMRRRIRGVASSPYLSISAILVESAALFLTFGVAFLVSMSLPSAAPAQNLIQPTVGQIAAIAPLLIILRVAQGRAWTPQTSDQHTTGRSSYSRNTSSASPYERKTVSSSTTSIQQACHPATI